MLNEFFSITPREVLDKLGLITEKPPLNTERVKDAIDNLPISDMAKTSLELTGSGDWGLLNSEEGSIVLAGNSGMPRNKFVLKFPLGRLKKLTPPLENGKQKLKKVKSFRDISPPTECFIARIDDPSLHPKVIIFQKKVDGIPICDAPINRLLKRNPSKQLIVIANQIIQEFSKKNLLDLIGLRLEFKNRIDRFLVRLIYGIPWFSDNIMIDNNDNVYLTDNTPEDNNHSSPNPVKKQINIARLRLSGFLINIASNLYSLFPPSS